jgi:hypothetical protein
MFAIIQNLPKNKWKQHLENNIPILFILLGVIKPHYSPKNYNILQCFLTDYEVVKALKMQSTFKVLCI